VNNARALRHRLAVLGSTIWAKENLFRLHEQRKKITLEYEILAPKLAFRNVPDEERKRFGPQLMVLRRCGLKYKMLESPHG
jgi:hypothetical protein